MDIGSQQWAVTTGILDGLQVPVHKAGYMSHSFKGPSTQVHCRTEQRSSSTAQGLSGLHSFSRGGNGTEGLTRRPSRILKALHWGHRHKGETEAREAMNYGKKPGWGKRLQ